ncbi:hypothetical protein ANCCEY_12679 [Ancylostoma ceylanicum]|uniref:Uncharacterized protein n=1 Tax=Ancylostoma ceylanicum TaxID=53326 RepID=A0A0D6L8P9_9BILA|nr:hypothetical protein ANCCEY_12679 [Ancylostoma ceylanicum]
MILGLFMAGSFWYKKPPPKENIFAEVARAIGRAIINKFHSKTSKEHWLDNYMDTHVCENDQKCLDLRKETRNKRACQKVFKWIAVYPETFYYFLIKYKL